MVEGRAGPAGAWTFPHRLYGPDPARPSGPAGAGKPLQSRNSLGCSRIADKQIEPTAGALIIGGLARWAAGYDRPPRP